jgi:putative aldouronate transport system substrate-binding protein
MKTRLIPILLVLMLLAAMIPASAQTFSEPVELIWYGNGTASDADGALAKMNEILSERYNTTIKVYHVGWNDWQSQYNLILTSGEQVDLIYVNSAVYSQYAPTGAFQDLTDLFPEYMPETYSYFTAQELGQFAIDGRIYAVPSSMRTYMPYGVVYRTDILDTLGVEPITSMETFEAYMDALAATGVIPFEGNPEDRFLRMFRAYNQFELVANDATSVAVVTDLNDPSSVVAYPFTDEYVDWAKRMKDYAGRGYWSQNALSSNISAYDSMMIGTAPMSIENTDGFSKIVTALQKDFPDYSLNFWPLTDLTGYAVPNAILSDAFAIPAISKNAERTLTVVEAIKTDPELYDLWMYGIQGYHYDLTPDGKLIIPAAGQADTVTYNRSSVGWFMRVDSMNRVKNNAWQGTDALMAHLKEIAVENKYGSVIVDYSSVQPELAAVNQVMQQYGAPINVGLVDDVDAAVAEYRQKLTEAGVEKLLACIQDQVLIYMTERAAE